MGLMKLKKNKKYNYQPRYYKGDGFELKHKFDDQRTTINPAKGIKGKSSSPSIFTSAMSVFGSVPINLAL